MVFCYVCVCERERERERETERDLESIEKGEEMFKERGELETLFSFLFLIEAYDSFE